MRSSTLFIARVTGLFIIVAVGLMLLDRRSGLERIEEVIASRALSFNYGVISLGLGLAVAVGQNVWRGGILPVVVTVLGWLMIAKGVALIWAGPVEIVQLVPGLQSGPVYYAYLGAVLLFGLYLAMAGFVRRAGASDRLATTT